MLVWPWVKGFVVGVADASPILYRRSHFTMLLLVSLLFAITFCKLVFSGGSEDWEQWAHQPEGGRAGWLSGAVQDQKAHSSQQTDESLLWTAGETVATLVLVCKRSSSQNQKYMFFLLHLVLFMNFGVSCVVLTILAVESSRLFSSIMEVHWMWCS